MWGTVAVATARTKRAAFIHSTLRAWRWGWLAGAKLPKAAQNKNPNDFALANGRIVRKIPQLPYHYHRVSALA